MREELLSWLLPEASETELAALRRVITALRLLRDDARRHEARAAPPWSVAHGELERLLRLRRRRLLAALLAAYLEAHLSADSFLDLGPGARDTSAAWRELLDGPGPVGPPGPGESAVFLVERLVAAGLAAGAPSSWGAYWRACAGHVFGSAAEAERRWRRSFAHALEGGAPAPIQARFLAGQVAAHLDRFQPQAAWGLFARHAPLAGGDAGLRRLFGWTALLVGDEVRARELLRGRVGAQLPRPLLEFRSAHPDWAPCLAIPARSTPVGVPSVGRPGRRAFGAELLCVVGLRQGAPQLLALECERSRRAALLRVAGAQRPPGDELRDEHRWRDGAGPFDCLGGASIAAVARAVVRDARGEPAGWVQLESAHGLLPSRAQLAQLASAWREEVLESRGAGPGSRLGNVRCPDPPSADDAAIRREFARAFLAALGCPSGVRASWLEAGASGSFQVLAERGVLTGALQPPTEHVPLAEQGIVARARDTADLARHAGEPGEVLRRGAAAGLALPLRAGAMGRVLALLVLESARGDPFDPRLVETLRARLASAERAWWAAAFRAWHRRRNGGELVLRLGADWLRRAEVRCGPVPSGPVFVSGPPGSGRRTLASWLEFRAARSGVDASVGRAFVLEQLGRERQDELARRLPARGRLWLVAHAPEAVLRARGELGAELAALEPREIEVPPLCARRDEIRALIDALARSAARKERLAPPAWTDEACAALWRQAWPGNVAELEAVVEELVLRGRGVIGPLEVRSALAGRGLACSERLEPATRAELEAALEATRHRNGSVNLARAARYLGWSSETVAAHWRRSEGEAPESTS